MNVFSRRSTPEARRCGARRCWGWAFLAMLLLFGWVANTAAAPATLAPAVEFERRVRPMLEQYCFGCHSTEKHKGDLDLEQYHSLQQLLEHPKPWQTVVEQLALGEMPPKEKPQPTAAERQALLDAVNRLLDIAAEARAEIGRA